MKKTIFLIFAVLVLSFSLSQNAEAGCSPGWDEYSVSGTYYHNGTLCNYTAYYCVFVDAMGMINSYIDRISIDYACIDVFTEDGFWMNVENEVINHLIENGSFSQCPLSSYNVSIKRSQCWKVINIPCQGIYEIVNCGYVGACQYLYKVCTDYTQNPPENQWEIVSRQAIGTADCNDQGLPDLPPDGKTKEDEWETDCFLIGCFNCN